MRDSDTKTYEIFPDVETLDRWYQEHEAQSKPMCAAKLITSLDKGGLKPCEHEAQEGSRYCPKHQFTRIGRNMVLRDSLRK